MKALLTGLVATLAFCGAVAAAATTPTIDADTPSAAIPSTAHLVVQDGAGARRVSLWTAKNSRGELCVGYRIGLSNRAPRRPTCLRRGLEQPLITAEIGGGQGGVATWGSILGIVAPNVAKVEVNTLYGTATSVVLPLRPIAGLAGWRSFTIGVLDHPSSSEIDGYDGKGTLLAESPGASINPGPHVGPGPIVISPPGVPPTGAVWSDSASNLPSFDASVQSEISLALADSRVRTILGLHGGWLDTVSTWTNCSGRSLGHVIAFRFPSPVSFTATLPAVRQPSGPFSYAITTGKVAATGWHTMTVWVDATSRAVVGIDARGKPFPGETGGQTVPVGIATTHDAGGPDPGSPACWQSTG